MPVSKGLRLGLSPFRSGMKARGHYLHLCAYSGANGGISSSSSLVIRSKLY